MFVGTKEAVDDEDVGRDNRDRQSEDKDWSRDHCGGKLYQREDDRPEAIRVRMEAYETSTAPMAEFYRRRGLLVSIAADGAPEKFFERTCKALK